MIEVEDFEATVEAEWAHVQSLHPDKTLDQLKKEAVCSGHMTRR